MRSGIQIAAEIEQARTDTLRKLAGEELRDLIRHLRRRLAAGEDDGGELLAAAMCEATARYLGERPTS